MADELRFEDELNSLIDHDPFVPFTILVASGDRYRITGPKQVLVGDSMVVIVPPKSTMSFFRKSQIVGVEVEEPAV